MTGSTAFPGRQTLRACRRTVILAAIIVCIGALGAARNAGAQARKTFHPAPARPPIVGVAHIALRAIDLDASRAFYGHVLGLADAFSINNSSGGLLFTCFKVNDHQYIELYPGLTTPEQDRLANIAFETTDARRLRDYLAVRGVEVPEKLDSEPGGDTSFTVKDPDGHNIEFVQYRPGSVASRHFGQDMPATRIGKRIIHVGVTVRDRAAADLFYKDILGFKDVWEGGMKDGVTDWVDMRVPNGSDWLEYMLNVHNPSPRQLGVMHHFSLGVTDIHAAEKTATARGYKNAKAQLGRDGKWQLNLYDPDFTRAEIMEFKPVRPPCCSPMILPNGRVLKPAPPGTK